MTTAQLGQGSGVLGALVATLLLGYALSRVRLRRVEIYFGEEMGQFLSYAAAILLVWLAMGLLGLAPGIGQFLGWDWIPVFMQRLTPGDFLVAFSGLLFSTCFIISFTLAAYIQAYDKLFLRCRRFPFPYTRPGRWTAAMASFYLSTVAFDLLRSAFSTETGARLTLGSAATATMYTAVIVAAPLLDKFVHRRGIAGLRGFSVLQLVIVVVSSSLIGSLLQSGSVHLGPIMYADFFRSITATILGVFAVSVSLLLAAFVISRILPLRLTLAAANGKLVRSRVSSPSPLADVPTARFPRWRRYDKPTGKRVDWP
jgi:hypothetical protein